MTPEQSSGTPSAASIHLLQAAKEIKHLYVESIKEAAGISIANFCPTDEQVATVIEKYAVEFSIALMMMAEAVAVAEDACGEEDPEKLA